MSHSPETERQSSDYSGWEETYSYELDGVTYVTPSASFAFSRGGNVKLVRSVYINDGNRI